ncbi:TPA: retention module-containing protein [Aeromonas veronii]
MYLFDAERNAYIFATEQNAISFYGIDIKICHVGAMDMRTQIIDKSVVVSAVEGNVEIVLADGSSRPLQKGEILQPGAKLTIADDAKLALSPYDDTPAQNSASGSESVEPGQPQGASPTEGAPADIAALQQSILQGVDPTQNFEASAAGGAPAAGGGGGIGGVAGASGNGGFVTIDRTGDATIAAAGFDTTYDTAAVINENQAEDLILENQLDDLGETVVTLEDSQVSGNLLENSTNPDGPADASIVSYDWGINIGVPAGVAATITGVGTLIINPDGSYTFTPAPNYDGAVPPVNYQVTDGQDTVTSTLVISITPVDEAVGLDGLTLEGGEVLVSDANLADGSAPNAAALTQSGVFTFNAPDGVQTLAIGAIQLISNGTVVALPVSIETPLGNGLQITAITYDPVTGNGSVSYSYTLLDNEAHQQPASDLQLGESLTVTLTDDDGDTTSATLDIVVLDDVPVLQQEGSSDTVNVDEDDLLKSRGEGESEGNDVGEREPLSLTASIVDNVSWGADGFGKVTGVSWADGSATIGENQTSVTVYFDAKGAVQPGVAGAAASLLVNADGSYTFTLADNLLVSGDAENIVKLLTDGFTFAAQDGDGDPVVGGIKVNVNITDDVPVLKQTGGSDTVDVDEDDLQALRGEDESEGNDAGEREPLSVTGNIVDNVAWGADGFGKVTGVSWSGGMATIDEGQTSVTVYFDANGAVQAEATGAAASLQVNADGSYTFTLADNLLVSGEGENVVKLLTDGFTFAAQDGDGDPVVGGIKVNVNITDDVPVVRSFSLKEGVKLFVDESVGTTGSTKDESGQATNNDESGQGVGVIGYKSITGASLFSLTVDSGSDGQDASKTKYELTLSAPSANSGLDATTGGDILLSKEDGTGDILGTADGTVVFRLHMDADDGDLTLIQYKAIKHTDISNNHDFLAQISQGLVGAKVTVYDNDGDSASSNTLDLGPVLGFEDDGPEISNVQDAVLANSASGYFSGGSVVDIGTDGAGWADLTGNISGWDGSSTTYAASALTSGGATVYYYVSAADPSILYAYTSTVPGAYTGGAGQSLIFTLSLNTSGNYVIDMNGKLDNATQEYSATFSNIPGGNQDYLVVSNTGGIYKPGEVVPAGQFVIMSIDSSIDSVNSSTQGLATDNQWVDGSEKLYFDFSEPAVKVSFAIDVQTGATTNSVNWTVYGTNANGELVTESGSTLFTDGVLQQVPTTLTDITRVELSDNGGAYGYRVQKVTLVDRVDESPVTSSFDLAVVDADGDRDSATLDVTFEPVVAPVLIVGTNADDVTGSSVPYEVSGGAGVITGKGGNDVLVGDVGGTTQLPGQKANIAFVLDNSGSMQTNTIQFTNANGTTTTMTRLDAMKQAVISSLNGLYNSGAGDIRVHLDTFATQVNGSGTFTLTSGGVDNAAQLAAAIAFVNAITVPGSDAAQYTNYEAGLVAANTWIESAGVNAPIAAADVNKVIFVSDGEPNRALQGNGTSSVVSLSTKGAMQHVLGTYDVSPNSNDDTVNEINLIENVGSSTGQAFTVEAVGIQVNESARSLLSQVEGAGGSATNVTNANQLSSVIGQLTGASINANSVGNDHLVGGNGNDVMFGDSIHADNVDGGWFEFVTDNPGKSDGQLLNELYSQHAVYGKEGAVGGDDTLEGGDGNDVLYGQKGNDILIGGEGIDILIGGTGSDILTGGAGKDTFKWMAGDVGGTDVIKDFTTGTGGDVLDISELLTGEHANSGWLDAYLNFSSDGPGTNKSTLTIDLDGTNGGTTHVIKFDSIDLTTLGNSDLEIIQKLLGDGNLKVDP